MRRDINDKIIVSVYKEDVVEQLKEIFSKFDVKNIDVRDDQSIEIEIPEEHLAKALGRGGSFVKLASYLVNKKIIVKKYEQRDDV